MIYLAKYTDKNFLVNGVQPGNSQSDNWEIIEKVGNRKSLLEINPFLKIKKLPIIDDLSHFNRNGLTLIYYMGMGVQLYIIDSELKDFKGLVRDYLITDILC